MKVGSSAYVLSEERFGKIQARFFDGHQTRYEVKFRGEPALLSTTEGNLRTTRPRQRRKQVTDLKSSNASSPKSLTDIAQFQPFQGKPHYPTSLGPNHAGGFTDCGCFLVPTDAECKHHPIGTHAKSDPLFISRVPRYGRLYDHRQDLDILAKAQAKAEHAQRLRELKDSRPVRPTERRVTIQNATKEEVTAALHRALVKKK